MEETLSLEHACYPLSISGWHIIGLIGVCIGWLFFLPVYNLSLPMRALVAIVAGTILGWSQFEFHSWLREAFLLKGGTGFDMLSSVMITLSITGICCIAFCLLRGACLPYLETCYGSKQLWLSNSIPSFNAKWLALFVVIGFISWHFLSFASGISIRLLFMRQMLWMAYALFAGFLGGGIYEMYKISREIKTQDWKLGRLETVSRVLDLFVNRECHMSDYVGYNIPLLTTLCSFFLFFSIGPALAALYQRLTCGWWP